MKIPPRMMSDQVKFNNGSTNPDDKLQEQMNLNQPAHDIEAVEEPISEEDRVVHNDPVEEQALTKTNSQTPTIASEDGKHLPILEAFQNFLDEGFQDFLDKERKRMHRRMVTLTLFIVTMFCALAAIGVFVTMKLFMPMQDKVKDIQSDVSSFQQANRTDLKKTRDTLNIVVRDIKKEKKNLLVIRKDLKNSLDNYDGDLNDIKKLTILLRRRNISLKKELDEMKASFPGMSGNIDRVLQEMESFPIEYDPRLYMNVTSVSVDVFREGQKDPIVMRLPFPE